MVATGPRLVTSAAQCARRIAPLPPREKGIPALHALLAMLGIPEDLSLCMRIYAQCFTHPPLVLTVIPMMPPTPIVTELPCPATRQVEH